MSPARSTRRFLRPGWLVSLGSGLWAVDEFQPVAAILDLNSGTVRDVVSWPDLPPPAVKPEWPGPTVAGGGDRLWVQHERAGAVLPVGRDGPGDAVWTDGLRLGAAGHGEAWCIPPPPGQQFVSDPDAPLPSPDTRDVLLRVGSDGRCDRMTIDRAVRHAYATPDGLVLWVEDSPGRARKLGDTYDIAWTPRYVSIPWGAELPDELIVGKWSITSDERPVMARSVPNMSWYDEKPSGWGLFPAAGVCWQLGRDPRSRGAFANPSGQVIAAARDKTGRVLRRYDLGPGMPVTIGEIDDRSALAVAVRRPGRSRSIQVVALRPGSDVVDTVLAADSVDITDHCWPLEHRPIEADSYQAQALAESNWLGVYARGPQADEVLGTGFSDVTTRLDGQWPSTHLEWAFCHRDRPGLRLRRRVPLYDELGRILKPEYADIHLMEDLATGWIPPATAARDGVLDI